MSQPGPEEPVSARLQWALARSGTGKGELAQAVGVHPSRVSRWTSGTEPAVPSPGYMRKVAEVLGVSPFWLQTGFGSPQRDAEDETEPGGSVAALEGRVQRLEALVMKLAQVITFAEAIPDADKASLLRLVLDINTRADEQAELTAQLEQELETEGRRVSGSSTAAAAKQPGPLRQGRA
jgi:transcriptional regulator with XRE-family HTH domain